LADETRGESKKVLYSLLGIAGALLVCLFIFEFYFELERKEASYFWVQMFSGSHWPEPHGDYNKAVFVLAATIHSLITAGPLLGVGFLVYKLMSTRSVAMTVAQALRSRDRSIKFAITGILSKTLTLEDKKKVTAQLNDAFAQADRDWKRDLNDLVGERQAKEIVDELESTKITE
jgi:hypothetical protein